MDFSSCTLVDRDQGKKIVLTIKRFNDNKTNALHCSLETNFSFFFQTAKSRKSWPGIDRLECYSEFLYQIASSSVTKDKI